MPAYFNGLALGLSLIMALGPQNIFLIRQGTQRKHAILSALVCFFCDIILICASITGLHHTLLRHPALQQWLSWFGVLFLLYYGTCAVRKGLSKPSSATTTRPEVLTRLQIIMLALGFSLLNPHAIIDSLVIIGGGSSLFPEHQYIFLMGVLTSSLLWFSLLTLTAHYFSKVLARAAIWQRIEISSGLLMFFLSFKLAMSLF